MIIYNRNMTDKALAKLIALLKYDQENVDYRIEHCSDEQENSENEKDEALNSFLNRKLRDLGEAQINRKKLQVLEDARAPTETVYGMELFFLYKRLQKVLEWWYEKTGEEIYEKEIKVTELQKEELEIMNLLDPEVDKNPEDFFDGESKELIQKISGETQRFAELAEESELKKEFLKAKEEEPVELENPDDLIAAIENNVKTGR